MFVRYPGHRFTVRHPQHSFLYILQRGVQWKQGVVIYMMLYTSLLYNTTPIHCTPLPLHPPVLNTRRSPPERRRKKGRIYDDNDDNDNHNDN